MAQSGNCIDVGAVYQLLIEMSARLDTVSARLDSHDGKFDQLLDVANEHGRSLADHTRQLDDLNSGMTNLRSAVADYHQTVIGHGLNYSELGERVQRIERDLKLEPNGD